MSSVYLRRSALPLLAAVLQYRLGLPFSFEILIFKVKIHLYYAHSTLISPDPQGQ